MCLCDEAANHQLPTAVAIFIILYLSTDEGHGGGDTYYLFGLEGHTHDRQHLPNKKIQVLIWLQLCRAFFGNGEPGNFHLDYWAFLSRS